MTSQSEKQAAAAKAASARSKGKKNKSNLKYQLAVGFGVGSTLFAVWLGLTESSGGGSKGGRASPDASYVNDASFIRGVNSDASGNFTAAASPYFDRWTYADVKYGLQGVALHGEKMIGMPGALSRCEKDSDLEGGALPTNYDVRDLAGDCIGEAYDAGNCSSSYAVAAAISLGSRFCISDAKYKGLRLSPQQVLSCDKKSRGCQGGGVDSVWGYVQRRGLYPEECVPFAGGKPAPCKTTCDESKKLKALSHCLLDGSEKEMKREIYNRGPVVAPMYVHDDFMVYEGGIYTPTKWSRAQSGPDGKPLVISVAVIGWGKSEGQRYWIIGGTGWGQKWGEKGFARVAVNSIVREGYAIVATPATEEALVEEAKKKEEAAQRLAQAKVERAEREARIAAARAAREEEEKAKADADLTDLDNDDLDDDIADLDLDEEKKPEEKTEA